MLISFVVPCFNVREFIEDCLDSLLKVVGPFDCEVIVVDDGSTDSTLVELYRWEARFPDGRYKVICQENKGLSGARNTGIENARGEYIFLLDSDDYLNVRMFSTLCDELEKYKPDAFFFIYYWLAGPDWYWETGHLSLPPKRLIEDKVVMSESLYKDRQFYSWAKVFRREIYDGVSFPEGKNYEDIATVPKLLDKSGSLYYLPVPMVFYRQRDNSIMKVKSLKNVMDLSSSVHSFRKDFISEEERYYRVEFYLYVFLWSMMDLNASSLPEEEKDKAILNIRDNFYESFSRNDLVFFIRSALKRRQYKIAVKGVFSYYACGLYWKFIKRKYK